MNILALWLGKTTLLIMQVIGRRGAALPGLVVERLFPDFLAVSLAKLPEGVVIITGTNGKTTSTKILTHVLRAQKKVLTNPTGSNFVRGIIASIVQQSEWSGRLSYDMGVFELDEAYAVQFVDRYKPRGVVVLNVMRDQMDRFGEIDHTAKLLKQVVKKATEFVILNGDDERVAAMQNDTKARAYFFGVDASLRDVFRTDDELHQQYVLVRSRPPLDAELKKFDANNIATIYIDALNLAIPLTSHGIYNAQNAAAMALTAHVLKIDDDVITTRISEVRPAFGRGEHIKVGDKTVVLQLVKNPGGFRHALFMGAKLGQVATMIAINDDYADGRDVSWLWDVNFAASHGVQGTVITTGTRAADIALRLKYDEIVTDIIEPRLQQALNHLLRQKPAGAVLLIYTTYTAMLELRKLLSYITEVEKI